MVDEPLAMHGLLDKRVRVQASAIPRLAANTRDCRRFNAFARDRELHAALLGVPPQVSQRLPVNRAFIVIWQYAILQIRVGLHGARRALLSELDNTGGLELASHRILVPTSEAARSCSLLAMHGITSASLPRRTAVITSRLALSASFGFAAVETARSRSVSRGQRRWHFTPEKNRLFRDRLSAEVRERWGAAPFIEYAKLEVDIFINRPADLSRKSSQPLAFPCNTKPDADNYLKAIADAMEGICYQNDSRIVIESACKWYVPLGEKPWFEVRLYEICFDIKRAKKKAGR